MNPERQLRLPAACTRLGGGDETGRHYVLVHPGALAADAWHAIAGKLAQDGEVHMLDLQSIPEYQVLMGRGTTVSMLAESLLDAFNREAGNRGALTLVGWSFGGVVAHQMASLLPEQVERVVLVDSIAPTDENQDRAADLHSLPVAWWLQQYLEAKRRRTLGRNVRVSTMDELFAASLESGVFPPGTPRSGFDKVAEAFVAALERNTRLTSIHVAPRLDIPLDIIRPERSLIDEPGTLGWDCLTTVPVRTYTCSGTHYSVFSDPAAVGVITDVALQH